MFTSTKSKGFTLIELMVVVALIGIIMGSVVLSVGDGGQLDRLEIETKRMPDRRAMIVGVDPEKTIWRDGRWTKPIATD